MRNPTRRAALWLLVAAGLFACDTSGTSSPPVAPERQQDEAATPAPDDASGRPERLARSPEEAALAYCSYTQGPVPHWLLAEELVPLIVESDRGLVAEIKAESEGVVDARHLPKLRAASRMLAKHTRCRVLAQTQDGDAVAVALLQEVPELVEPRDRRPAPALTDPTALETWCLTAFEQASTGAHPLQFGLIVRRVGDGWLADPQLETRFGRPRRAAQQIDAAEEFVRHREWQQAAGALPGCEAGSPVENECRALRGRIERGLAHWQATGTLRAQVTLRDVRVTAVVSGANQMPTLQVALEHGGSIPVDGVWVAVRKKDGSEQVCQLFASITPPLVPLSIPAGEAAEGVCRLATSDVDPATARVVDVLALALWQGDVVAEP